MTDKDIETLARVYGGLRNGDVWLFRDAELHHFVRAILAVGHERCAKWVEARSDAFCEQHGSIDPDTGFLEFGRGAHAEAKSEYVGELEEIAEGLRALGATPKGTSMSTSNPKDVASTDGLGPLVERLLKYSDIRRNDPQENRETLRDLIAGELADELRAAVAAERDRFSHLRNVVAQVLIDMRAQGVLLEWHTMLSDALSKPTPKEQA